MRSIRMRLFLSIGCIFLIIAILSWVVPNFFVRKDIDSATTSLNSIYTQYQKRLQQLSGSWVTYRFKNTAAQLSAVSQMIRIGQNSPWQTAAAVIGEDPNIAVVQVTDRNKETAVISLESAKSYSPLWAKDEDETLWIKIAETNKVYRASPLNKDKKAYLLYYDPEEEDVTKQLTFKAFEFKNPNIPKENNTNQIFAFLR